MEVSDSGDVKCSTPHQALLGSCCQSVCQRLSIYVCLFAAQPFSYPFETQPFHGFIWVFGCVWDMPILGFG